MRLDDLDALFWIIGIRGHIPRSNCCSRSLPVSPKFGLRSSGGGIRRLFWIFLSRFKSCTRALETIEE